MLSLYVALFFIAFQKRVDHGVQAIYDQVMDQVQTLLGVISALKAVSPQKLPKKFGAVEAENEKALFCVGPPGGIERPVQNVLINIGITIA